MTQGDFLFNIIQSIALLIPSMIIFYNLGKYQGKIDQKMTGYDKSIDGIGKKVSDIRDTHTQVLSDLKTQIDTVSRALDKMTVIMEFIKKDIEELKKNGSGTV